MKILKKSEIMEKFSKILIKILKLEKFLPKKFKLKINENIKKFNFIQNKLMNLLFNLQYITYIDNFLQNSKKKKFNKNFLKKKIIQKFFQIFQIFQKAKNPNLEILEFLKIFKNLEKKFFPEKKKIFKTGIFFEEKKNFEKNKKFLVLEKIKKYLKKDIEFKIFLDDDFILSILFIVIKQN